jgi:hypothetical protein
VTRGSSARRKLYALGLGITGATAAVTLDFQTPAFADANGCSPTGGGFQCLEVWGTYAYIYDVDYNIYLGTPETIKVCNYQAHWWGHRAGKIVDYYSAVGGCSRSWPVWMDSIIDSGFDPGQVFCGQFRESDISIDEAKWRTPYPCLGDW